MNNIKDFIIKELLIVIIMGCVYTNIEMIFRGYTHPSMIIVGGLCGMLAGLINDITPEMKMYKQCILSAIIITIIEYKLFFQNFCEVLIILASLLHLLHFIVSLAIVLSPYII